LILSTGAGAALVSLGHCDGAGRLACGL